MVWIQDQKQVQRTGQKIIADINDTIELYNEANPEAE